MSEDNLGRIVTRCSQLKALRQNFELVAHQNKTRNTEKKTKQPENDSKSTNTSLSSMDMKKARFEVYKFSKSNLNFTSRQNSNVELAIQLGAKPPKKEFLNYKKLMENKKLETEKKNEETFCKKINQSFRNKIASKKGNINKLSTAKSKGSGILRVYGKVKPNQVPKLKKKK